MAFLLLLGGAVAICVGVYGIRRAVLTPSEVFFPNFCGGCASDLRGQRSGMCPVCGVSIAEAYVEASARLTRRRCSLAWGVWGCLLLVGSLAAFNWACFVFYLAIYMMGDGPTPQQVHSATVTLAVWFWLGVLVPAVLLLIGLPLIVKRRKWIIHNEANRVRQDVADWLGSTAGSPPRGRTH